MFGIQRDASFAVPVGPLRDHTEFHSFQCNMLLREKVSGQWGQPRCLTLSDDDADEDDNDNSSKQENLVAQTVDVSRQVGS